LGVGTAAQTTAADVGNVAATDNILKTTDFVGAVYADADVSLQPAEGAAGSALDIYLNGTIDAADINDDQTDATATVTGVVSMNVTCKNAA